MPERLQNDTQIDPEQLREASWTILGRSRELLEAPRGGPGQSGGVPSVLGGALWGLRGRPEGPRGSPRGPPRPPGSDFGRLLGDISMIFDSRPSA